MCFARHTSVRARSRRTERPRSFRHHQAAEKSEAESGNEKLQKDAFANVLHDLPSLPRTPPPRGTPNTPRKVTTMCQSSQGNPSHPHRAQQSVKIRAPSKPRETHRKFQYYPFANCPSPFWRTTPQPLFRSYWPHCREGRQTEDGHGLPQVVLQW